MYREFIKDGRFYTPEAWKAETGKPWPEGNAVYWKIKAGWNISSFHEALVIKRTLRRDETMYIICAAGAGKPDDGYVPETEAGINGPFPNFDEAFLCFRFATIHRRFYGTDESLLAVFAAFELLHNFRDLMNALHGNRNYEYALSWYKSQLKGIREGVTVRPDVLDYVCKSKGRKREKLIAGANKELAAILRDTGLWDFFIKAGLLDEENGLK